MKGKNVIVTGSEGFIGKALVEELKSQGANIIARIDRVLNMDAVNMDCYGYDNKNVDYVFHLAAQTSVWNANHELIAYDNELAFRKVVSWCNKNNAKLIYASSSTAYIPNMTSHYGLSKFYNEQYALMYCPMATGVRLHNVYGSNPRQGTLFWKLLNQESVYLYNNGENKRCFTYIDDAVAGLIYAAHSDKAIVNVFNAESMRTREFARIVQCHHNVKVELIPENKERDKAIQYVDETIFREPLQYKSVREAMRLIFAKK